MSYITTVEILNISFEQGTPFDLVFTWTDLNGNPIDITGYKAQLLVATDLIYKTPIILFSSESGGAPNTTVTLGGTAGTIQVQAPDFVTAAMTFETAVYSLIVQSPTGVNTKLLEGTVVVLPGLSWEN